MADEIGRQHDMDSALSALRDDELMRQVAAGNNDALTMLVRRHQDRIWSLAYYFSGGQRHDADDVTQETILRLWQSAPKYSGNGRFDLWLYRVVANLCLDGHRRQRRWPQALRDEDDASLARDPAPVPAEISEVEQRVRLAVQSLPERQRLALVLHRYKSLAHRQIAEITGWTESAVESLLVRAYAALRDALQDLQDK